NEDDPSGYQILGRAGANLLYRNFPNVPFSDTWYPVALANNLAGEDLAPERQDINAVFNSNVDSVSLTSFYYGLDGNSPSGRFDIVIILLHEFAHGLGFSTITDVSTGEFRDGFSDVYSRFILDRTAGQHWSEMETNEERVNSATRTLEVVWDGDNVNNELPNIFKSVPALKTDSASGSETFFQIVPAPYGAPLTMEAVTGVLELIQDASGAASEACEPILGFTPGRIAVIDRGNCHISQKVQNAQDAGAIAAVIVDNGLTFDPVEFLGGDTNSIVIPLIGVTLEDGNRIKENMMQNEVTASIGIFESPFNGADPDGKIFLYTPNPLDSGSSIAHWDPVASPNLLMEPILSKTTYDVDVTLHLLQDIGWNTILSNPSSVKRWNLHE
ncbi:peptidase, partial [bacterium]|nr:peptidase [bacterium]